MLPSVLVILLAVSGGLDLLLSLRSHLHTIDEVPERSYIAQFPLSIV